MRSNSPSFLRLRIGLWGLLTAAGSVVCVATLMGFFGRFSWFLDLFSHFRVQYLLSLSILAAILAVGRRRKTAITFMVFAAVNLALVQSLYFGGRGDVPDDAPSMRAMLLNVNTRLGDPVRVKQVVLAVDPDILVLEEISGQWISGLGWLTNSHPHSLVQPREDNFGIGLYSKRPLTETMIAYIGDAEVPTLLATVDTGGQKLRVIATHPPPPGGAEYSRWRNDQLDKLPDHIRSPLPLILLGDLNATAWNDHFRRLLRRTGLLDSSQGRGVQPTWPSASLLFRIPIDHCLHSPDVAILQREVGPDVGSDHFPVIVDFVVTRRNVPQTTSRHTRGVSR